MACAAEKTDKTRTAAFYLAPAQASRPHGQFTDSAKNPLRFSGVSSTQGIMNPITVGSESMKTEGRRGTCAVDQRPGQVSSLTPMRLALGVLVVGLLAG